MSDVNLTKGQRRRANERRKRKQTEQFAEQLGPILEYHREFMRSEGSNIHEPEPPTKHDSWQKAPAHLIDYDETPSINQAKQRDLSAKGNAARMAERDQRIADLRLRYSKHWGTRRGALLIAETEGKEGNKISFRTLLNYFKLSP